MMSKKLKASLYQVVTSLLIFQMAFFQPLVGLLSFSVQAQTVASLDFSYSVAEHSLQFELSDQAEAEYRVYYQDDEQVEAVQGQLDEQGQAEVYLGTCSDGVCVKDEVERLALKVASDDLVEARLLEFENDNFVLAETNGSYTSTSLELDEDEEFWLAGLLSGGWKDNEDGSYSVEEVSLYQVYEFPLNKEVSVTFTELPDEVGSLTIEEVQLSEEQVEELGALSEVAYEITSDMDDGSFVYDLTLPNPQSDEEVQVKHSEDGVNFEETGEAEKEESLLRIRGLDHFTTFVVTSPNSPERCDIVLSGTTSYTACFPTIQQAINNASDGDKIYVGPGFYSEYLSINNKAVSLIGDGANTTTVKSTDGSAVITVNLNGVTTTSMIIEGFTIDADNTAGRSGIYIQNNSSNVTFQNNEVINFTDKGVLISSSDNNTVLKNRIAGSSNGSNAGIYFDNKAANNTIKGNDIDLATSGDEYLLYGIHSAGANSKDNIVENNLIDGSKRAYQQDGGVSGTVTFKGNTIGNTTPPSFAGIYLNGGSAVISDNTIKNAVRPIEFWGADNVTILNNTIDGSTFDGINSGSYSSAKVTSNTFKNINSNHYALNNRQLGSQINAENNDWGVAGCPSIQTKINGDIDYLPYEYEEITYSSCTPVSGTLALSPDVSNTILKPSFRPDIHATGTVNNLYPDAVLKRAIWNTDSNQWVRNWDTVTVNNGSFDEILPISDCKRDDSICPTDAYGRPFPEGNYKTIFQAYDGSTVIGSVGGTEYFTIDNTAPVMTGYGLSDYSLNATENSIILSGNISDVTSPIDSVKYSIWDSTKTTLYANWTNANATDGAYDSKNESTSHIVDISTYPDDTFILGVRGWDLAGNKASGGDFYFTIDTTDPAATVNSLSTTDTTPELTGTVDDNTATIQVNVDGNSYSATNNGDNTWILANNTISTLSDGIYDVIVTATDPAGNNGTDATTDELIVDTVAPNGVFDYYKDGNLTTDITHIRNVNQLTFNGVFTDLDPSAGLDVETFTIYEAQSDGTFGWGANGAKAYCSFRREASYKNAYDIAGGSLTNIPFTDCSSSVPDGEYYVMNNVHDKSYIPNRAMSQYRDVLGLHFIVDNTPPTATIDSIKYSNGTVEPSKFVTNYSDPVILGTAIDTNSIKSVSLNVNEHNYTGTMNGDNWEANVTDSIPDGLHTMTVTVIDKADNEIIVTRDIRIDTGRPTADYTYYRSNDYVDNEEISGSTAYIQSLDQLTFTAFYEDPTPFSGLNRDVPVIFSTPDFPKAYCGWSQFLNSTGGVQLNGTGTQDLTVHQNLLSCVASLDDGEYFTRHRVYDNATRSDGDVPKYNQHGQYHGIKFVIDTDDPKSTINLPAGGTIEGSTVFTSSWTGNLTGTATDNNGVADVLLSIQRNDTNQYWNDSSWIADPGSEQTFSVGNTSWSYIFPSDEVYDGVSYTVKSHAVDLAGNVESTHEITIVVDKAIDEVELTVDPTNPDGDNGWYKTKPRVTLKIVDDNFKVLKYQWDNGSWVEDEKNSTISFDIPSEGIHVLRYKAADKAGNETSDNGVKVLHWDETTLNEGPLNVSVSPNPTNGTTATVTWDAATDDILIDKYEVIWQLNDTSTQHSKTVSADATETEIDQLTEGEWTIKVKAFDGVGNSKEVSVGLTVDQSAPAAPVLSLDDIRVGTAVLSWSAIDDAEEYLIYYGTTSGDYIYGANVGAVTDYTVSGLGTGDYFFIVRAKDAADNQSPNSNEVNTGTIAGAPGAVPGGPAEGFIPAGEVQGVATEEEGTPAETEPTNEESGSVMGVTTDWWQYHLPWILLLVQAGLILLIDQLLRRRHDGVKQLAALFLTALVVGLNWWLVKTGAYPTGSFLLFLAKWFLPISVVMTIMLQVFNYAFIEEVK